MLDVVIVVPEITKGMKSIGSKALLKIKDSLSILEYQIQQIKKNKKYNIHIIAGFEIEKIQKTLSKYKVNIVYNSEYLHTNQTRCIRLFLENHQSEKLFIIGNGIIFKNNPFDLSDNAYSKVFMIDKPKANFNIGCTDSPKDNISYLFYDLPVAWSECAYLSQDAIHKFLELSQERNLDQMYIFEMINVLLSRNIKFDKQYISKKDIMKINSVNDLPKAKLFI